MTTKARLDTPISDIRVAAYRIPTDRPEADGTIAWNHTTLVCVHAQAGTAVGLDYTYADNSTARLIHDTLAAQVNGLDAFDVPAAWTGAVRDVTLGYYDIEKKEYLKIPMKGQFKVLSLIGDIALDDSGKPKLHAHIVIGQFDGTTRGGNLLEAQVRPTLEVILEESPTQLQRRFDAESGLALIRL